MFRRFFVTTTGTDGFAFDSIIALLCHTLRILGFCLNLFVGDMLVIVQLTLDKGQTKRLRGNKFYFNECSVEGRIQV